MLAASLSPSALFSLLFSAVNCLVVADAIRPRCVCSRCAHSLTGLPLPACGAVGAAGLRRQLRAGFSMRGEVAGAGLGRGVSAGLRRCCLALTAPEDVNRAEPGWLLAAMSKGQSCQAEVVMSDG